MSTSDDAATTHGVAAAKTGNEIAYQAGVAAASLDEAVRRIDECLFLLAADDQLTSGPRSPYAPDAITDMAGDLERSALRMNAVANRLAVLGGHSLRLAAEPTG